VLPVQADIQVPCAIDVRVLGQPLPDAEYVVRYPAPPPPGCFAVDYAPPTPVPPDVSVVGTPVPNPIDHPQKTTAFIDCYCDLLERHYVTPTLRFYHARLVVFYLLQLLLWIVVFYMVAITGENIFPRKVIAYSVSELGEITTVERFPDDIVVRSATSLFLFSVSCGFLALAWIAIKPIQRLFFPKTPNPAPLCSYCVVTAIHNECRQLPKEFLYSMYNWMHGRPLTVMTITQFFNTVDLYARNASWSPEQLSYARTLLGFIYDELLHTAHQSTVAVQTASSKATLQTTFLKQGIVPDVHALRNYEDVPFPT